MSIGHYILAGVIAFVVFCFTVAIFTLVCLYLTELLEGLR